MKKCRVILMLLISAGAIILTAGCTGGNSGSGGSQSSNLRTLHFQITDSCNDDYTVYYKFYDDTDNQVWPSSTNSYYIAYGQTFNSNLSCENGANICLGASDNTNVSGAGLDNSLHCSGCCYTCENSQVGFDLTCGGGISPSASVLRKSGPIFAVAGRTYSEGSILGARFQQDLPLSRGRDDLATASLRYRLDRELGIAPSGLGGLPAALPTRFVPESPAPLGSRVAETAFKQCSNSSLN